MKTSKCFLSTLIAAAAMTATAWAGSLTTTTTTISSGDYAGTYSGGIAKITPSSQFHSATFNVFQSDSEGVLTWGSDVLGTASAVGLASGTGSDTFWKNFASNQSQPYGNTLYISAANASTSINTDFSPFSIGGLIVENNADVTDYTVTLGRSKTSVELCGAEATGFQANVHANTTILGDNGINVNSNATWKIASEKTVTLSSSTGVSLNNGSKITVSGGGSLTITKLLFTGSDSWTFDGGLSFANSDRVELSDGSTVAVNSMAAASGFTGTVTLKNITHSGSNFYLGNYGVAGSKIVVENVGGDNFYLGDATIAADIEFKTNFEIKNGGSATTRVFSGTITGSGAFVYTKTVTAEGYKFTGDLSGFSGGFRRDAGGTGNAQNALSFGDGGEGVTTGSVSGTGTIQWGANSNNWNVVYNYSNDVYASNAITAGAIVKLGTGALEIRGENTSKGGVTVSAGTLVAANAKALGTGAVSVAADATLKFSVAVSEVGAVTLAEGATFALDLTGFMATATDENSIDLGTILSSTGITFGGADASTLSSSQIDAYFSEEKSVLGDYADWERKWSYNNGALSLTMATIPEPSAFGLLAGLGALALVGARRRRR